MKMYIPSIKSFGTKVLFNALFVLVSVFMTAAFAHAQLQQCANGAFGGAVQPCDYQNGNLHGGNSQWAENQFVPYRAVRAGLTVGSTNNTITISYDSTVSSGKHGIDYLGSYNTTQTNGYIPGTNTPDAINFPNEGNDPCGVIPGCALGSFTFFPIPLDTEFVAPAINPLFPQIGGQFFSMFGGTITSVSAYTLSGTYAGASITSVTITYTANQSSVVLAFGGHVSSRVSWGALNSAVDVQGSPYHVSSGSGDRSMKVEAQGFPAKLTIIKDASRLIPPFDVSPLGFEFTRSFGANFTLFDDGVGSPPNDPTPQFMVFDFPLAINTTTSATVTELVPLGWTILDISCVDQDGGLGSVANSTPQPLTYVSGSTATANMNESELVTCTFSNGQAAPTAADVFLEGRTVGTNGRGLSGINVTLTDINTGQRRTAVTNTFGYFKFEDLEIGDVFILSAFNKRYTFEEQTIVLNDNVTGVTLVGTPR